jgi:hypothetical protein
MNKEIQLKSTEVKVAVIGTGYWGKNLVRNYAELGALYGVCDSSESALASFRQKYPKVKYTTNYLDLLKDDVVRGVGYCHTGRNTLYPYAGGASIRQGCLCGEALSSQCR